MRPASRPHLPDWIVDEAAQAQLDGLATPDQVALLEADEVAWLRSLWRLLERADNALERARQEVRGPERATVLEDLDSECYRIDDAITALTGELPPVDDTPPRNPTPPAVEVPEHLTTGVAQLQLGYQERSLVAWVGGLDAPIGDEDAVRALLGEFGAGSIGWEGGTSLKIPNLGSAPTVTASLDASLGWLVGMATNSDERCGVSTAWMGRLAAIAVEHVAQGRFALGVATPRDRGRSGGKASPFHARWNPALLDPERIDPMIASLPGTALLGQSKRDKNAFTNSLLGDLVHAIVATASAMVDLPASPPDPKTRQDVGEALLAHLDGNRFEVPYKPGAELAGKLKDWAKPVSSAATMRLVVQVDPPDESNGWFAQVFAPAEDGKGGLEPVELAENSRSKARSRTVRDQTKRLERLFPALLRPGGRRRGQVILSQDEAWRLMSDDGQMLEVAGFEMRVPDLAPKKATAALRLTTEDEESVVGAQQLANVRWSVVFDDVELSADDIAELSAQARPLVQSKGQWVELDKVDLAAAAEALEQRADTTRLTGADMLRHALGLEGNPLAGGIDIAGDGWAAELLRGIDSLPEDPDTQPPGFAGELRSYQADALAWLNFLDEAGLGGCLALDMGLGKTPTALASFVESRPHGTGLVIAPPAVVGNWASEAKKFVPDLDVYVHHGPSRASGAELRSRIRNTDLVITTYGIAVRDMDLLSDIHFGKIVIDEAQAIKNPAAETSQQLRRLDARTKVALTGTPIENGLGDLWSIMDWANPGLVGDRTSFIHQLTPDKNANTTGVEHSAERAQAEDALKALNGVLVYRRTKAEPEIAEELPDRIDELDHCAMTTEQIGLYQAVIDGLVTDTSSTSVDSNERKGAVLAAITALKQICNHPVNYRPDDDGEILGRSGKIDRLLEIMEAVYAADEKMLIFTHFATWGERLAEFLSERTGQKVSCYHGGLSRTARDKMVEEFETSEGAGAMVLSLKAGGTGLNLTAANHVVLYDRWWNPAVEDQARDRVWRIGQTKTVICHRLVCPGTVDERVEEVVAGKRHIADMVLPKSSSIASLDANQLQAALGLDPSLLMTGDEQEVAS